MRLETHIFVSVYERLSEDSKKEFMKYIINERKDSFNNILFRTIDKFDNDRRIKFVSLFGKDSIKQYTDHIPFKGCILLRKSDLGHKYHGLPIKYELMTEYFNLHFPSSFNDFTINAFLSFINKCTYEDLSNLSKEGDIRYKYSFRFPWNILELLEQALQKDGELDVHWGKLLEWSDWRGIKTD